MITVARPTALRPAVLAAKDSTGAEEREAAAAFYADPANVGKSFEFKAYGHLDVRDALEKVFRNKCAYCETEIGAGAEFDVEHWRPKNVVKQLDGTRARPGYWWLAADWGNLLLSCLRCNRVRKYQSDNGEETKTKWESLGKGELFPLADPALRWDSPKHKPKEQPLLLDPCRNKVEGFFRFVVEGDNPNELGVVTPRYNTGRRSQQAWTSIQVYGLNRPLLVAARRRLLAKFHLDLQGIVDAYVQLEKATTQTAKQEWGARLDREAKRFLSNFEPGAPYQLMLAQAIDAFEEKHPRMGKVIQQAVAKEQRKWGGP